MARSQGRRGGKRVCETWGMGKRILCAALWCAFASRLEPDAFAGQGQAAGQETTGRQSLPAGQKVQTALPHTQQSGPQATGNGAKPPAIPPGMRPLSLKEGRGIVERMAWADDEEGLAPDCSHLVHRLYQQAGYPYPYARSLDLYRGTGQFLRVRYPQLGDLIVWLGHVGIVVNPREHSFFSSVTSGTRIEDYSAPYWRARGYPHFYRYLTKSPLKSGETTETTRRSSGLGPTEQAVLGSAENRPSYQGVKASPAASTVNASGDGAPGMRLGGMTTTSATRAENVSQLQTHEIPLRTHGKQPSASEVTSALETANVEGGEILRAGNLEQLERPVVVYRQLQVSGVELKGKRGMAQIQIETLAALTAERIKLQLGWEDHQLELWHTKKGWVMVEGQEIAYVPREAAMRVLAERLAALAQGTERSTQKDREQADIVRVMNLLIE